MRLDECIQQAIDGGDVDPELGRKAQQHYRKVYQRELDKGLPDAMAALAAADEVIEGIAAGQRSRRRATLAQLAANAAAEPKYATAHLDDPGLIVREVERTRARARAIEKQLFAGMFDFLATFRTDVAGRVRQPALMKELVSDLHAKASGNAAAAQLAKAVAATFEKARAMANAAGMDIARLADWGLPHTHDALRIRRAGFDAWFSYLYDGRRLDWSRILNPETGKPFVVAKGARPFREDAVTFLRDKYASITTGGWDDRTPTMAMRGKALANRSQEHRSLHFNEPEDWYDYNTEFGQNTPFEAITGHVRRMARDIAALQVYGPNPAFGLEYRAQIMERNAALIEGPEQGKVLKRVQTKIKDARILMDDLSGRANIPHHEGFANLMAGTRDMIMANLLAGASLWTPFDNVTGGLLARSIRLNPVSPLTNTIKSMTGGMSQKTARELGLILGTWSDSGVGQVRTMGEIWSPQLTRRINNTVMRLSLMNFMTDHNRRGLALAIGSDMADRAHLPLDRLEPELQVFLRNRDITEREWDAIRHPQAIYTDEVGGKHLSDIYFLRHTDLPEAEAQAIAIKWGTVLELASQKGVVSNSMRGNALFRGGAPGTLMGELALSARMFKSYPLALMFEQIETILEMRRGVGMKSALGYVATAGVVFLMVGAIQLQLDQLKKGRDPLPMFNLDFWGMAALKSGGLGVFGDLIKASTSRTGGGFQELASGPVIGLAGQVARNIGSGEYGRATVNIARLTMPGATYQPPIPLPTQLAIQRLIFDQALLWVDPDAEDQFRQAERRLNKDFKTHSWWERGKTAPSRAPDLSNAFGGGQ